MQLLTVGGMPVCLGHFPSYFRSKFNTSKSKIHVNNTLKAVVYVIEVLCYKSEGRGFDTWLGHWIV
jgi:hypothetical protein